LTALKQQAHTFLPIGVLCMGSVRSAFTASELRSSLVEEVPLSQLTELAESRLPLRYHLLDAAAGVYLLSHPVGPHKPIEGQDAPGLASQPPLEIMGVQIADRAD